jgi:hypothetical protein
MCGCVGWALMLVVAESNVHVKEVCGVCDTIATKVVVLVFHVHDKSAELVLQLQCCSSRLFDYCDSCTFLSI